MVKIEAELRLFAALNTSAFFMALDTCPDFYLESFARYTDLALVFIPKFWVFNILALHVCLMSSGLASFLFLWRYDLFWHNSKGAPSLSENCYSIFSVSRLIPVAPFIVRGGPGWIRINGGGWNRTTF